ncbi:hypothetical protein E2K80_14825 [Rhodophyticola sp. CCM32]|uniref:L,D-transpeptidase family protein n=1 Tax=Rhodophyticola sp. CCM32 TaxID=2916397 RepID=UPI00107F3C06|nr:L,D-transpeptidase family protein [Rhodophyticola sp. CCM32]QBY01841.1 hypothetical protein E2K80_14825 [Rhodophyticola sp. CCM32]
MTPADLVLTPTGLRFMGRSLPCVIGRSGITTAKREGDGATPAGAHRIIGCLYRPDRIARPCPWTVPLAPGDLWSDDPRDADYNLMVRAPHAFSHERLCRADPLYDLVLLTDWNWPRARPGRGSAIFLHQWRRPGYPTEGCIAFDRRDLNWITRRITPDSRVIVPPLSSW